MDSKNWVNLVHAETETAFHCSAKVTRSQKPQENEMPKITS